MYTIYGEKINFENQDIYNLKQIGSKIIDGTIKKIVCIGDSITDGYGGTGYNGSSSTAISTNTDGYCWVNMFKAYLGSIYGTAVINTGMFGSVLSQQVEKFDETIPSDTDLVIWLTGTNNRGNIEEYKGGFASAIKLIRNKGVQLLVMSGIPSTESNELSFDYTMRDISDVIIPAVNDNGDCKFLALYDEFINWCKNKEVDITTLFYDHVHPNDLGYEIMFKIIMHGLGIPLSPYNDYSASGDYYPFTTE